MPDLLNLGLEAIKNTRLGATPEIKMLSPEEFKSKVFDTVITKAGAQGSISKLVELQAVLDVFDEKIKYGQEASLLHKLAQAICPGKPVTVKNEHYDYALGEYRRFLGEHLSSSPHLATLFIDSIEILLEKAIHLTNEERKKAFLVGYLRARLPKPHPNPKHTQSPAAVSDADLIKEIGTLFHQTKPTAQLAREAETFAQVPCHTVGCNART